MTPSPSRLPIRGLYVNPAEKYRHYPDTLLLDLSLAIRMFRANTLGQQSSWRWDRYKGWWLVGEHIEWSLNDTMREIIGHILVDDGIEMALDAMGDDLSYFFPHNHDLAEGMVDLGREVYRQLKGLHAYDAEGILPYQFCNQWLDRHTPIFEKVTYEDIW